MGTLENVGGERWVVGGKRVASSQRNIGDAV
jgi:hypothetical protein